MVKRLFVCLTLIGITFHFSFAQTLSNQEENELNSLLKKVKPKKLKASPIKNYENLANPIQKIKELRLQNQGQWTIPSEFETPILFALSYYPELRDVNILFLRGNIKTTMACRPTPASLLRRNKRDYQITIDTDAEGEGILLKDAPLNAQIGVIGHELAHIVDYENRSSMNIANLAIDYARGHYPPRFEKSIDLLTIQRGLGWQLYDWSFFVLYQSKASKNYKEFKKNTYLTPNEIKAEMKNLRIYDAISYRPWWKTDILIEIWGVCIGVCLSFTFIPDFRNFALRKIKA